MQTITRTALVLATETALAKCPDLTKIEKLALRLVAATTEEFGNGVFANGVEGRVPCPLEQAGMRALYDSKRMDPFWGTFDRQVEAIADFTGGTTVQVID